MSRDAKAAVLTHSVEECAEVEKAVRSIADAAQRVLDGPLTANALCLLVRDLLPRGVKSRISVGDIEAVLDAASQLSLHLRAP